MYFRLSENPNSPIACNVPHAGLFVPDEFKKDYPLDEPALTHEVALMADNHTDLLYKELLQFSSFIASTISRVVVDIERFEDEEKEPMSAVGMSAFYTKTSAGTPLRSISPENRSQLESVYRQYHEVFGGLTRAALANHGKALIVDCHSFPSLPRAYEPDQQANRPDICIGTDAYHTPTALRDILQGNFLELGYVVAINSPFAGSIVPMEFYQKDKRVVSVMIEVNRKLYMDEATFEKLPDFNKTSQAISRCIIKSLNELNSLQSLNA